jgi:hypothetical protein
MTALGQNRIKSLNDLVAKYSRYQEDVEKVEEVEKGCQRLLRTLRVGGIERSALCYKVPEVVHRLMRTDESKTVRTGGSAPRQREDRKAKTLRRAPKAVRAQSQVPGVAHYAPNFDAVLAQAPKVIFSKPGIEKRKRVSYDDYSMSEITSKWTADIRHIEIDPGTNLPPANEDKTEVEQTQKTAGQGAVGLIARGADRSSFLRAGPSPGPGDYDPSADIFSHHVDCGVLFDKQSSRPDYVGPTTSLRDVGWNIDMVKPKSARPISFDKQSSREPAKPETAGVWEELERMQAELIQSLTKGRKPSPPPKKRTKKQEPFSKQSSCERNPFGREIRIDSTPKAEYDVDVSYRALERPKTAFNIKQPSLKRDRQIYRKSDAPDVFYDNVVEQSEKTRPRAGSAVDIGKGAPRHDVYHYMPHTDGSGEFGPSGSTLDGRTSVVMKKMARRKCMIKTPGRFRNKRWATEEF